MYMNALAQHYAFIENDEGKAIAQIDDTIALYPNLPYPKFTKLDICEKFCNIDEMGKTIQELEKRTLKTRDRYEAFIRYKCIYLALSGDYDTAKELMDQNILHYTESAKEMLGQRLQRCQRQFLT
jgi:hypothetical protein